MTVLASGTSHCTIYTWRAARCTLLPRVRPSGSGRGRSLVPPGTGPPEDQRATTTLGRAFLLAEEKALAEPQQQSQPLPVFAATAFARGPRTSMLGRFQIKSCKVRR
jgi:hypothetical protein